MGTGMIGRSVGVDPLKKCKCYSYLPRSTFCARKAGTDLGGIFFDSERTPWPPTGGAQTLLGKFGPSRQNLKKSAKNRHFPDISFGPPILGSKSCFFVFWRLLAWIARVCEPLRLLSKSCQNLAPRGRKSVRIWPLGDEKVTPIWQRFENLAPRGRKSGVQKRSSRELGGVSLPKPRHPPMFL